MNRKAALDRALHGVAGAGAWVFFAVATAEGCLRPGYDWLTQPISALALGARGWVQEWNFVVLGASLFSFAVVLRMHLRAGAAASAARLLFGLMAIGALLAGAFTMDAEGASPTRTGRLHDLAGFLVFPPMSIALLLLASCFRRDADWRPYFSYTLATGLFCLATLAFFLVFVGLPSGPPRPASAYRGLIQRSLLIALFVWITLVTRRARRANLSGSAPAVISRISTT